jgi:hypothetical protein
MRHYNVSGNMTWGRDTAPNPSVQIIIMHGGGDSRVESLRTLQ